MPTRDRILDVKYIVLEEMKKVNKKLDKIISQNQDIIDEFIRNRKAKK
jgi:hypothetical protein